MVREGGFAMKIVVDRKYLQEERVRGASYVRASPGNAFHVSVSNDNHSTYLVRLYVDGREVEPGYREPQEPATTTTPCRARHACG